jgi:hypothetical protein
MMRAATATIASAFALACIAGCGTAPDIQAQSAPRSTASRAAAAAFVTFATGRPDRVPWAEAVTYSIAGHRIGTFHPGRSVASALRACPAGDAEIEGRSCPVSPLDAVRRFGFTAATGSTLPDHVGCNRYDVSQVPSALRAAFAVIRPPQEKRDCAGDFAVALFLDKDGSVAWIDYTLSGP